MYTIEEGQYVRTIYPLGCIGPKVEISYLAMSYQGAIFLFLPSTSFNFFSFKKRSNSIFSCGR